MGRSYAAILYRHGFRVAAQPEEKLDFAAKSESEVRRVFPEILDEIRGFAEGCHASYNDMAAFMLTIGAFKPQPMCSSFAAFNGSDVIFGRNYDFFYSFKKYTESYLTAPEDAFISLGHSDVFIGREDGINEDGLAVAMTGLCDKAVKPGVSFALAVRSVLDKCASVKEASESILGMHASANANFLLADDTGDMAVAEVSPDKVMVRRPEKGENFIVCTNHFVLPEMQQYEDLERRKIENWDTIPRYLAISENIRKEGRKMTRLTILVACAVFFYCFNPRMALTQPYYAPYLLLWHQSVENQARIQELQRQLGDVRLAIGGLQKDLNSIFELQQRLQELEISNQNTIKTLLEELSRMQKEIVEIRRTLNPENE